MDKKILFVSCMPDEFFKKLIDEGRPLSQACQKFNKLIVNGFCYNGYNVDVLFAWSNFNSNKLIKENVNEKEISYNVISSEKKSVIGILEKKKITYKFIKKWAHENKNGTVVVDALSPLSYDVLKFSSKFGLNAITVVTDLKLDSLYTGTTLKNLIIYKYIYKRFYKQFKYASSFVLLTEQMAKKINLHGKKYIVINGMCDKRLLGTEFPVEVDNRKVIMYTGEISEFYGAKNLVDAFLLLDKKDIELHLYGSMFYDELPNIEKKHANVKYMGIVPNEEMIKLQKKALFLVNPRLTKGEYNSYSFPSKNIEYMTTGRPVITTKLPCITDDYKEYFYFFKDDTAEGMAESLKLYINLPDKELEQQGRKARKFVLEQMNNQVQIERVIKELL